MPPEFWQMCPKHQYAHQVLQGGLARRCLLSVLGDNLSTTAGSLDKYGAVERGGQKFGLATSQNPVSPQHKCLSMVLLSSRKLSGTSEEGAQIPSRPTMRFFLLWFCVLFLLVSRLRAVSFPEDDEPLNTVDYHCKSPKAISCLQRKPFVCLFLCLFIFSIRDKF